MGLGMLALSSVSLCFLLLLGDRERDFDFLSLPRKADYLDYSAFLFDSSRVTGRSRCGGVCCYSPSSDYY